MRCPTCGDPRHGADRCPRAGVLDPGTPLDDKYVVVRHLSSGGMGAVYEVEHTGLGKRFAAKVLLPELARRREVLERFRREARAASAIGHEHIVDVTDLGETAARTPFIVMELLRGRTLGDELTRLGRLPAPRAVHVARQVLSALAAAHERSIIHRDLKPDNIFLVRKGGDDDFVKVLDFGISKFQGDKSERELTTTGAVVGTPSYMAPEQARGEPGVDHRVDLYAVGAILYRMLTGTRPYQASNFNALVFAIAEGKLVPPRQRVPEIPPHVEAVVLRAMSVRPERRYASAREFDAALVEEDPTSEWAGRLPAPAANPAAVTATGTPSPALWSQQSATMMPPASSGARTGGRRVTLILAGIVVLLATTAGGVYYAQRQAAEARRRRAEAALLADAPAVPPPPAPALLKLRFDLDPPDARLTALTVDGAAVDLAGAELARDGQRHVLHAEADGFAPLDVPFLAAADQTLAVHLKKKPPARKRPRSLDGKPDPDDPAVKALLKLVDGLKDEL